jgi:hypothetical protein
MLPEDKTGIHGGIRRKSIMAEELTDSSESRFLRDAQRRLEWLKT